MSNGVRSKVGQIIFSSHRALAHVDCLSEKGHTACVLDLDWKRIVKVNAMSCLALVNKEIQLNLSTP